MYLTQADLKISQLRNAHLWNEQRRDTAANEKDAARYDQNARDLGDAIYDIIRYEAVNY